MLPALKDFNLLRLRIGPSSIRIHGEYDMLLLLDCNAGSSSQLGGIRSSTSL